MKRRINKFLRMLVIKAFIRNSTTFELDKTSGTERKVHCVIGDCVVVISAKEVVWGKVTTNAPFYTEYGKLIVDEFIAADVLMWVLNILHRKKDREIEKRCNQNTVKFIKYIQKNILERKND